MIKIRFKSERRFLVPEVVQTSAMDCGPASLKCLLEGFNISVSYGRLREACQTSVDGTSIDTMEDVVVQLGLEAEQIMIPADHILIPAAQCLPAIVTVCLPNGVTHFVVAWQRYGPFVQVMDPATGRRWLTRQQFLDELYIHSFPVPAIAWREWAGSEQFLAVLRYRISSLGIARRESECLIDTALADAGWYPLAVLDATTRMVDDIVCSGGLRRGKHATRALENFFERARVEIPDTEEEIIPSNYWSVQPALPEDGEEMLLLRGAVLVRAQRRHDAPNATKEKDIPPALTPELLDALEEKPSRPEYELLKLLLADGVLTPASIIISWTLGAIGVIVEALLFRGLIDIGQALPLTAQRFGMLSATILFLVIIMFLHLNIVADVQRLGRRLEARLRIAFSQKIPRLGDRYFRSRLISDMAERSHNVHQLRDLAIIGAELVRWTFVLILTTLGIIWLDPQSTPIALFAAALALSLPILFQSFLAERDMRVRSHIGALGRFYLDALLGLVAVRIHGAERAVRREHESLLVKWAQARLGFYRAMIVAEGLQVFAGFGCAVWLLFAHLARGGDTGNVLLLVYWTLNLPVYGREIALLARRYPTQRNVTLRLLEPLGAPEEIGAVKNTEVAKSASYETDLTETRRGVSITLEDVSVRATGHIILEDINLNIPSNSHVAIVGPSGAGKTSLVSLLLGWHRPDTGHVLVDDILLDGQHIDRLRQETAWVDPAIQIWNRSFLDNLCYGNTNEADLPIGMVVDQVDLRSVLERLPDGLQTSLGEGGGLVSGGEGQRVRLGRALLRRESRLVILDEPFRGLDRDQRSTLLTRTRELWRDATLLCITHDVGETQNFERVLVMAGGKIIEDGNPTALFAQSSSRYRAMLEAETKVRDDLWSGAAWRRLWLADGVLSTSEGEN